MVDWNSNIGDVSVRGLNKLVNGPMATMTPEQEKHFNKMRDEMLGKSDGSTARSKYHREIKPGVWVDVYDVLNAWVVQNPALQHLVKKALQPGVPTNSAERPLFVP